MNLKLTNFVKQQFPIYTLFLVCNPYYNLNFVNLIVYQFLENECIHISFCEKSDSFCTKYACYTDGGTDMTYHCIWACCYQGSLLASQNLWYTSSVAK